MEGLPVILFAVIGYRVGKARGMSSWGGALVGLFLGPAGILVLWMWPSEG